MNDVDEARLGQVLRARGAVTASLYETARDAADYIAARGFGSVGEALAALERRGDAGALAMAEAVRTVPHYFEGLVDRGREEMRYGERSDRMATYPAARLAPLRSGAVAEVPEPAAPCAAFAPSAATEAGPFDEPEPAEGEVPELPALPVAYGLHDGVYWGEDPLGELLLRLERLEGRVAELEGAGRPAGEAAGGPVTEGRAALEAPAPEPAPEGAPEEAPAPGPEAAGGRQAEAGAGSDGLDGVAPEWREAVQAAGSCDGFVAWLIEHGLGSSWLLPEEDFLDGIEELGAPRALLDRARAYYPEVHRLAPV